MGDASHLLQVLHLFEVSAEYVGGGLHGFDGGVTCIFGCSSCLFSGFPSCLRRVTRLFARPAAFDRVLHDAVRESRVTLRQVA